MPLFRACRCALSGRKWRIAIEQLELVPGELEEQVALATTPGVEEPAATNPETPRRKPVPEALPRDVVEHATPCECPTCGGALRPPGEDVTEGLEYVPVAKYRHHLPLYRQAGIYAHDWIVLDRSALADRVDKPPN